MLNILKEVAVLRQEGKLHSKLIKRVGILLVISVILAFFSAYNVVFRNANAGIAIGLFVSGFVIGLYVFSRMNVVQWNEELEVVEAGRMDALGYAMIALYIVFEISLRTYLHDTYPVMATAFILAAVSGTLLGRGTGILIEIHRVFTSTHQSSNDFA